MQQLLTQLQPVMQQLLTQLQPVMQQLLMQQVQQQETKLLQATRLVLQLPRAVTILRGQPVVEEEQQQADQQQVKVKVQAAVLQAAEKELPAALKVAAAVDNLKAYSEAVNRNSTITTTIDREALGLFIFLILLYV